MNDARPWVIDTRSDQRALGECRRLLDTVWSAHPGVPAGVRTDVSIAAGEIAANILQHTGRREGALRITMEVRVLPGEVRVVFIDDGHRADVDLDSVRLPADEMAERGRGLAVARKVLRHLSYRRTDAGNQWTLVSERFGD